MNCIEEVGHTLTEIKALIRHNDFVLEKVLAEPITEWDRAIYGVYTLNRILGEQMDRAITEFEEKTMAATSDKEMT
ncbi:MAG: hypothetical protein V3U24_05710 [Candidatus Neomarinimicrobiota bacterium]